MSARRRSGRTHDVVFYVPHVTPLLIDSADRPSGGAETQIALLAGTLAQRGVRVCLVAFPSRSGASPSLDGVDVLVRPGHEPHQGPVGALREAARIWHAIAQVRTPVVVTRNAGAQVGLVGLSAKLLRRRFIYSSANVFDFDFDALGLNRRDLALYRLGLRLADEIVVQTREQVELCEECFGRSPVLIRSISEAAPARSHRPDALLWIGRLVRYKRPLAFVELARSLPGVRFRMVGVPLRGYEDFAIEVARAAASIPNLEFLEPRPRSQLMDLMSRAVAIVNTSDYEGMPNIFLEGWSRGVPALALTHDPDGVIERHALGEFAHGSKDQLVALARRLWVSRYDQSAISDRCRRYVYEHHPPDLVASQWREILGIGTSNSGVSYEPAGAL